MPVKKMITTIKPRQQLAKAIVTAMTEDDLTQLAAAHKARDAASQFSLISTASRNPAVVRGFSMERLIVLLNKLGRDVTITVQNRGNRHGKLTVVDAGDDTVVLR
jgi:hypothetical protein